MSEQQRSGPGYASPEVALQQPPEDVAYIACLYEGTGIEEPDFLAVVDTNPASDTFSRVVERLPMPNVGDELHHYGWNACSSACHSSLTRDTLVVPGIRSSRLHLVDVSDPRRPQMRKVIEPEELIAKTGYTRPHTVHCMPGDIITISMLGNEHGELPGGFAVLDAKDFSVLGRWDRDKNGQEMMYDFWYQPRHNTLVSSEWAAPNVYEPGFDIADVQAGRYGRRLHFWDLDTHDCVQSVDLGDDGQIPLEIRWQHDPDSLQGFLGVTLSSTIKRFAKDNGSWSADTVIQVPNEELAGWPLPGGVPGLITDIVLAMNDRDLFFANWLHGDVRHYDVSDPRNPVLRSQVWLGGLLGRDGGHPKADGPLTGGPQMIQCSLDGNRLYVANSLYSTWDNQFYPGIKGWLTRLLRQDDGTFALDPDFFVDFTKLGIPPPRPHEVHLPGGDCATEIFQ
jgi:selenium-binding protein 1